MADPSWIKKTVVLAVVLAVPALVLLTRVWRERSRRTTVALKQSPALWIGIVVLVTYCCWFLNVLFEWSVAVMIAWPLAGILLAVFGCGLAFSAEQEDRMKLLSANALLLVLALSSIIAPN